MTDDIAVARNWPTTESRLGTPNTWLFVLLIVAFLAIGLALVAAPPPPNAAAWYGAAILAGASLFFPFLLSVAVLKDRSANKPFQHASHDVLPEVPRRPLLEPGQVSVTFVTHRLEPTATGMQLVPDPRPFQRLKLYSYAWINFIAAAVTAMVWVLSQGNPNRLALTVGLGLVFLLLGNLTIAIAQFLTSCEQSKLGTLEIDSASGRCVLTRSTESTSIDGRQVLAVQLCSARRRVTHGNAGTTSFAALETNLVWSDDPHSGSPASVRRATLMNLYGGYHRAVPIARQLADVLGVPLLNHATTADWDEERHAAKLRMAEPAGGYM